jgi:hypothetical protein
VNDDQRDAGAEKAAEESRHAKWHKWFWTVVTPFVCIAYVFDLLDEKIIDTVITAMSGIALVASYRAVEKAADSEKAGYENP